MTPVVYRPSGQFSQVYSDEVPPRGTASVVNQGDLIKVRGGTVTTYTYIPGGTSTAWSYSGTVLMFQKPLPQEELFALDAQVLVDELKSYVTSNGSGVPPARGQMMKRAFTAHAKIDFGHDIEVTAGAPPATTMSDASPPPVGQPRTVGAIQEKIDLSQVYFYDAFQSHMEHAQDKTGGKVALGFTITPNGTVKECHVALNTFTDKMFVATLLSVCRHFQFGPENVLETNVEYYPMEFTPLSETSALTNR